MIAVLCGEVFAAAQNTAMSQKVTPRFKRGAPKHFIKAWRTYRGYTQEQLAEMIGVSHGAIGQLERGLVNYTQPMLEGIAEALACGPADLIMRDPNSEIWSIVDQLKDIPADQHQQVIQIVSTFRKAS